MEFVDTESHGIKCKHDGVLVGWILLTGAGYRFQQCKYEYPTIGLDELRQIADHVEQMKRGEGKGSND